GGLRKLKCGWGGKGRERRKEPAPGGRGGAAPRDPAISSGLGQFGAIQAVAPSLGLNVSPVDVRDVAAIERAVGVVARQPNGGLIVTGSASAVIHRDLIITLQAACGLFPTSFRRRWGLDLLRG